MKLFQPDNFSSASIKFAKLKQKNKFQLREILDLYYKKYSIISIQQLDGTEINSNNYKVVVSVKGKKTSILLRRFLFLQGKNNIDFHLYLMVLLKKMGVTVCEPVASLDGNLFIENRSVYYAVFNFIKGTHFKALEGSYLAVAKEIGKMHQVLKILDKKTANKIKKLSKSNNNIYYNKINYIYSVRDLEKIEKKLNKNKPGSIINVIKQELPFLKNTIQEVGGYLVRIKKLPKSIIHSDLHPHNLLMNSRGVSAVLDFDSMRESERARDVAVAVYRLGRQFLINTHFREEKIKKEATNLKNLFLKEYCAIYPLRKKEIELMPIILKDEFLRKILVVLKGAFEENYFTWAKDIKKFIMAIKEINYFWA